jgi:hypothetical protein
MWYRIAKTDFNSWFKDSKIIDENGKPKTVYHGTRNNFSDFELGREGTNSNVFGNWKTKREGLFFAETPEYAEEFATQGEDNKGANIIPAHLSLKNPLDLRGFWPDEVLDGLEARGLNPRYYERLYPWEIWEALDHENGGVEFVAALRDMGYDGLLTMDTSSGQNTDTSTVIAFNPEHVRSSFLGDIE